ncbi:MAG: peptidoglycan-binding protein [Acidobacteriaceae bacterium]|nr:peptidoglycan-binding protein [Acidobacteriaceae bacterium]
MKWVFALTLLGSAALPLLAGPVKKNTHTKTTVSASSTKTRKISAEAHASASSASSNGKKGSTSSRSHHGRGTARAAKHTPPAPSYQLHPDPERYQEIQQALAGKGYFKGDANGQWGDDSVDALKRFQADQKLDPDGKINALSLIDLGLGPKHGGGVRPAVPPSAPPAANGALGSPGAAPSLQPAAPPQSAAVAAPSGSAGPPQ